MRTTEIDASDARASRDEPRVERARRASSLVAIVVLVAAIALQVAFVIALDRSRPALDHDEILSQMVASGHEDSWPSNGRTPPVGTWVSSGEIRHFLELDGQSSAAEVR